MRTFLYISLFFLFLSCGEKTKSKIKTSSVNEVNQINTPLLRELNSEKTGITFSNKVEESEQLNYFTFEYMYNGGGVATGDFNKDGLEDIVFTGNQVDNEVYLNKGNLQFENISSTALGVQPKGWSNGVVVEDVNADGWLDIYISRGGNKSFYGNRENLLYINNGDLTFTERAAEFGINDSLSSIQSLFSDFDQDGDLDLIVINHPVDENSNEIKHSEQLKKIKEGKGESDHYYLNENGKFKEHSSQHGINNNSFGLGVGSADLNNDGQIDLYISNDYYHRDYLFLNNQGLFYELGRNLTKHMSNFGMGVDIADINNDGANDIMVLDMAYPDHVLSKQNMASMSPEKFTQIQRIGEHKQFMQNTLQLNVGNGNFSEIAQFAGVDKTDWSWAPLFCDLNNDGFKDLLITNGFKRDAANQDFIKQSHLEREKGASEFDLIQIMPTRKVANKVFANSGRLKFEDKNEDWGFNREVNSNGMAVADFDNDGDMDIVINHMDEEATVFENTVKQDYIQIVLENNKGNSYATGAKCEISYKTPNGDVSQYGQIKSAQGYLSGSQKIFHFGLKGIQNKEVLLKVTWPNGKVQNEKLTIGQRHFLKPSKLENQTPLQYAQAYKMASRVNIPAHFEDDFNDYKKEILLPHSQSRFGPAMAKADVNNDGKEEVFINHGYGHPSFIYQWENSGMQTMQEIDTRKWEVQAAHFFDFDQDGDQDLYLAIGGNVKNGNSPHRADKLFVNNNGKFSLSKNVLPEINESTKAVVSADFNQDGFLDLFVGGLTMHGSFPLSPNSFLLMNENGQKFKITELGKLGMISSAVGSDYDKDGDADVLAVGELNNLIVFKNENGKLMKDTSDAHFGFWQMIYAQDLDGDGDDDYILGNFGENNKFHPTPEKPLDIYAADFDKNGTLDIVLGKKKKDKYYPVRGRECSSQQMPFILNKFPSYTSFSTAEMEDIYGDELKTAPKWVVNTMSSYVVWNDQGSFNWEKLPYQCQLGPIYSCVKDENKLLLIGNMFDAEPETVSYDASPGMVLKIEGENKLKSESWKETGFFVPWNAKNILAVANGFIFGSNNQPFFFIEKQK